MIIVARLPSEYCSKLNCLVVPGTGSFNGHWSEDVSCGCSWLYLLVLMVAARLAAAPVSIIIITNEEIKVTLSRKRCRGTLQDYDYSTLYLLSPISMV